MVSHCILMSLDANVQWVEYRTFIYAIIAIHWQSDVKNYIAMRMASHGEILIGGFVRREHRLMMSVLVQFVIPMAACKNGIPLILAVPNVEHR